MKTSAIVATVILSFAALGTAQAQLAPFDGVYGKKTSTMTHDQVMQEYKAARAAGLTGNQDMDNQPFTPQQESATDNSKMTATPDSHRSSLEDTKFGDSDNTPFQG
jgi:hypothetical protein